MWVFIYFNKYRITTVQISMKTAKSIYSRTDGKVEHIPAI